jgi:arylsulfatase A-like enzyme
LIAAVAFLGPLAREFERPARVFERVSRGEQPRLWLWLLLSLWSAAGCRPSQSGGEPIRARRTLMSLLGEQSAIRALPESGPGLGAPTSVTPYPRARGDSRMALLVPMGTGVRVSLPPGSDGLELELALAIPQLGHTNWESKFKQPGKLGIELRFSDGSVERVELDIGVDIDHAGRAWKELRLPLSGADALEISSETPRGISGIALGLAGFNVVESVEIERAQLADNRPGLLLVTIDTLRADRLGSYGYALPTTPELDRWSQAALRFEQAFSPSSWTWPSTASLLTGLTPPAHGVLSALECQLAEPLTSLGEVLQQAGFTTGFFTTNPLLSAERGFGQGFERFVGGQWEPGAGLLAAADALLDAHPGARPGLYFQPTEPHLPYDPADRFRAQLGIGADPAGFSMEEYRRGAQDWTILASADQERLRQMAGHASLLYDAEVAAADAWFGELRRRLTERGLWDNLIVAVTSDHGEEFFEHGQPGHARQLYPEGLHVPLLIGGPGIEPGRCSAPVPIEALPGTLLRRLGVSATGAFAGLDLLEVAAGRQSAPGLLFASTDSGWWPGLEPPVRLTSARTAELAWLRAEALRSPEPLPAQTAGYRLATDPEWQQGLSSDELAAQGLGPNQRDLADQLQRWWQQESQRAPHQNRGADAEAQLRAAGYLESER